MHPTERFTGRAAAYARHRPSYPAAVLDVLRAEAGLRPEHVVVDVGSGTGISSELFLANGNTVYAVEPNSEMRAAAEERLRGHARFQSLAGSAEQTGLPGGFADFIVAATAFHWFQTDAARAEFRRILKPEGKVVLLWNVRRTSGSEFGEGYEALLERYSDYYKNRIKGDIWNPPALEARLFGPGNSHQRVFDNSQVLDFEGLTGRLVSASYAPQPGEAAYERIIGDLRELFDRCQRDGLVRFEYETVLYWGTPGKALLPK